MLGVFKSPIDNSIKFYDHIKGFDKETYTCTLCILIVSFFRSLRNAKGFVKAMGFVPMMIALWDTGDLA